MLKWNDILNNQLNLVAVSRGHRRFPLRISRKFHLVAVEISRRKKKSISLRGREKIAAFSFIVWNKFYVKATSMRPKKRYTKRNKRRMGFLNKMKNRKLLCEIIHRRYYQFHIAVCFNPVDCHLSTFSFLFLSFAT